MPVSNTAINDIEKKQLNTVFRRLKRSIAPSCSGDDIKKINLAYKVAYEGHAMQRRKSGEPYLFHPLEVARICYEEIGLGPTAIVCAILHDVVEDTPYTLEQIVKNFGPKIGLIVDGLTKLDGMYNNSESPQAENFKKVISTLVEDVRVVLIKMADRVHNMRTLGAMPRHKQLKIAAETEYIYAPLAHRLGLYKLKTEFQDIIMRIQEPEVYEELQSKLEATERQRNKYIKEFISPLRETLDETGVSFRVLGRPKSISSIYNKIQTKKVPFEEIYDLFAVRVILDVESAREKTACWQFYSIITDVYRPIPERLKDWITTPKGNGYESLHTTVIGPKGKYVEVQIRTERMDEIAERGFAAHWKYKGVKSQSSVFDIWLDNVRDILDTSNSDALEFVNDFKTNLFSEEVYVFTPKGDMRILPQGATALDFAFDIHSEVGYHATALKVNNKLVPMGYELQNGDQVSVTTSKNQKPTEDWLKIVVTGKARSKIRSSMKEERRKQGELGKEALMRKLKSMKAPFEDNVDILVKHFETTSRAELFYAIAMEEINPSTDFKIFKVVDHKLVLKEESNPEKPIQQGDPEDTKAALERRIRKTNAKILVNGEPADTYGYSFGHCCNPVEGDSIFAYLTNWAGLKIHRTNCKNATNLLANYGYRVLKAEWVGDMKNNFIVDLVVTGVDSGIGVIQKITERISVQLGINIRSFSIAGDEGYFEGKIGVVVMNTDQLNQAIKALREIEGISNVVRIEKTE
jgi:guanosine-3',5'-bis(diphosphate) 3'-pyrophosphohydrolase